MKTINISYAILMVRVKSIFRITIFRVICCRPPVVQIHWEVDGISQDMGLNTILPKNCESITYPKLSFD